MNWKSCHVAVWQKTAMNSGEWQSEAFVLGKIIFSLPGTVNPLQNFSLKGAKVESGTSDSCHLCGKTHQDAKDR